MGLPRRPPANGGAGGQAGQLRVKIPKPRLLGWFLHDRCVGVGSFRFLAVAVWALAFVAPASSAPPAFGQNPPASTEATASTPRFSVDELRAASPLAAYRLERAYYDHLVEVAAALARSKGADGRTPVIDGLVEPKRPRLSLDAAGSPRIGGSDAAVTLTVVESLTQVYARRLAPRLDALLRRHGDRLALRSFTVATRANRGSGSAAVAASCAGEQGRYWDFRSLVLAEAYDGSRDKHLGFALRLGLDVDAFSKCLDAHGVTPAQGDTAHGDTAHGDTAHGDTAHGDTVNRDAVNRDAVNRDAGNGNASNAHATNAHAANAHATNADAADGASANGGVDPNVTAENRAATNWAAEVVARTDAAKRVGITSTPVVLVNGVYVGGAEPNGVLEAEVLRALGVQAPVPELRMDWKLTGVLLVPGSPQAVFVHRSDGSSRILTEGDRLDAALRLSSIRADHVLVETADGLGRVNLESRGRSLRDQARTGIQDEAREGAAPDHSAGVDPEANHDANHDERPDYASMSDRALVRENVSVVRVDRSLLRRIAARRSELESQFSGASLEVEGKKLLKLTGEEHRGLLGAVGLHRDDVVLRVNDAWVWQGNNTLFEQIERTLPVTVVVMRKGFPRLIELVEGGS